MPKKSYTGWWQQPFLWRSAKAGMLIQCRCRSCRRMAHYLAADLVGIFHKDAVVGELWGQCPRCGKADGWIEKDRFPSESDVGHTVIRRPNGFRQIRLWRDEYYGP